MCEGESRQHSFALQYTCCRWVCVYVYVRISCTHMPYACICTIVRTPRVERDALRRGSMFLISGRPVARTRYYRDTLNQGETRPLGFFLPFFCSRNITLVKVGERETREWPLINLQPNDLPEGAMLSLERRTNYRNSISFHGFYVQSMCKRITDNNAENFIIMPTILLETRFNPILETRLQNILLLKKSLIIYFFIYFSSVVVRINFILRKNIFREILF